MNVVDLRKSLEEIYDWREAELIVMKQLPISSRLSQKQKKVVTKYSVANIYAIWEGFVKDAIKIYIREREHLPFVLFLKKHKKGYFCPFKHIDEYLQ